MAASAKNRRKNLKSSPPQPVSRFQSNFTEVFLLWHNRNTSVKLLWNRDTGWGGDDFKFFLLFLALAAILYQNCYNSSVQVKKLAARAKNNKKNNKKTKNKKNKQKKKKKKKKKKL